ncbi:methyltransferase domain-containing protein [Candidatus Daviesbacteria bacterium]|nr:methyltransferase domain-containing protein [Candidatus Daviesbacteria bacterium]
MENTGDNLPAENLVQSSKFRNVVNKLCQFESRVRNEVAWPIFSLLFTLRPVHLWVTGNRARIEKGDKVLEVGSGYPSYKVNSGRVGKEGVFVSLDINPNISHRNKKIGYWLDRILRREKHDEIVTADAGRLPFSDNSFDVVMASNFTGGNMDYIQEAYRVLKPGGRLVTAFMEVLIYPYASKLNAKACKKAGFEDVKIKAGLPGALTPALVYLPAYGLSDSLIASALAWNWDVVAKKPEGIPTDLNSTVTISGI